jgi:hypothetical protein
MAIKVSWDLEGSEEARELICEDLVNGLDFLATAAAKAMTDKATELANDVTQISGDQLEFSLSCEGIK